MLAYNLSAPHGGGGGGFHPHGGGGGGGFHPHGGGGHWHGGGGGWGWGPEVMVIETNDYACPMHLEPVLATDGRVYESPCLAARAGVAVVRHAPMPSSFSGLGLGAIPDSFGPVILMAGLVGIGALVWAMMPKGKRR